MHPEIVPRLERMIRQARAVQLHGMGEPLASAAFWYNLTLLSSDCHSEVNTNFTLASEARIARLVGSNLKLLNVSVDAARPETYRRIRGYS